MWCRSDRLLPPLWSDFCSLGLRVLLPLQSLPAESDVQCAGGDAYTDAEGHNRC